MYKILIDNWIFDDADFFFFFFLELSLLRRIYSRTLFISFLA